MKQPVFLVTAALLFTPAYLSAQNTGVKKSTSGDTAFVRTTGNGVWGAPKTLIEEKRVLGQGGDNTFGSLGGIAALPNGNVMIYDSKALSGPAILMFDQNGKFIRKVGRSGAGPGEYSDNIQLVPTQSNTLLLWDFANSRVNRYNGTGEFLATIKILSPAPGGPRVRPGSGNAFYVQATLGQRAAAGFPQVGYIHYNELGHIADSILPLHSWLTDAKIGAGLYPTEQVSMLSDGRILVTGGDRMGFLTRSSAGKTTKFLLAERPVERAKYQPEERKAWEITLQPVVRLTNPQGLPALVIPEEKPAIGELRIDVEDRIWLRRIVTAVKVSGEIPKLNGGEPNPAALWRSPIVYNVFRADGTFLGEITFPTAIRNFSAYKDVIWATFTDQDGQPMLIKYRIPGIGS